MFRAVGHPEKVVYCLTFLEVRYCWTALSISSSPPFINVIESYTHIPLLLLQRQHAVRNTFHTQTPALCVWAALLHAVPTQLLFDVGDHWLRPWYASFVIAGPFMVHVRPEWSGGPHRCRYRFDSAREEQLAVRRQQPGPLLLQWVTGRLSAARRAAPTRPAWSDRSEQQDGLPSGQRSVQTAESTASPLSRTGLS